jgi:hypothetical protein
MRNDQRRPSTFQHVTAGGMPPPPENWEQLEQEYLAGVQHERTFSCLDCMDQGFLVRLRWVVKLRGWYSCAWYCDCDKGRRGEAGYWFGTCYPHDGAQRVINESGERELDTYLRRSPEKRAWLPDAIGALRLRYEESRKRKLRQIQEGKDAFLAKVDPNV